jgi:hypothetical protein
LIEPGRFYAVNVSLFYPRTLLANTERRRLNLELGAFYSEVGAVRGAAFSFGVQRIERDVEGYSWALVYNRAGHVKGVQVATLINDGHGPLVGLSYANIANYRNGDIEGLDASGVLVLANGVVGVQAGGVAAMAGELTGVQTSTVVSYASGGVVGAQGAGVAAVAKGDVDGAQLAGVFSLARDVNGAQAAGVVNLARDVRGGQIGLANIARRVRGVQLGVVNVADTVEGGAIGVVNVAGNGRIQPSIWFSGPGTMLNGGVKFVTSYTYTLLGAGYDARRDRFAYEASLGLHLGYRRAFAELGAGAADIRATREAYRQARAEARGELRIGYEILPFLTPFAGGRLTRRLEGEGSLLAGEYFVGLSAL